MKEQLITFETAKLAKDKGFYLSTCPKIYKGSMLVEWWRAEGLNLNEGEYSAPTQSLLQKWLREKHQLEILFNTYRIGDPIKGVSYGCYVFHQIEGRKCNNLAHWTTYENALEKGLQEALKLIP